MFKIAHTADTHIGEYPGPVERGQNLRLMDIRKCTQAFVEECRAEKPDLIVHAGDLTNKSKLWADQANKETQIASDWMRELTAIAPTVLLLGTLNHDNIEAFRLLERMQIPNLYICTQPELLKIQTRSGMIQVAAVPGFEKNYFRAQFPGLSPEEENRACTQALNDIILGLGAMVDRTSPSILLSHYTIIGCQYDNGNHVFAANEVVINQATLEASPFDLICMGHIHIAQKVPSATKPIYYSGTLQGTTFNEEGQQKGFWIHELQQEFDTGCWNYTDSRFLRSPAREFETIYLEQQDIEEFNANDAAAMFYKKAQPGDKMTIKDKIVRVKYECDEETNKIFNRMTLEKQLYNAGAFYVSEITPEKIKIKVSRETMDENKTPEQNLREYLTEKQVPDEEAAHIMELAAPLIAAAEAKVTAGKLIGMFEPIELEVKNYRSFWDETFNFEKITFATVNGINGNGKSAFFMDAIATCLYEETRSGDLTSWICNDPTNPGRSGSIIFTFKIGETKWRVSRTRAKGGKTTLNLSEEVNGQWENRSLEKTADTQDKIIKLLGMDAMTFKCCALIMQDQYGLFLQADKEDRMKVLADILGLGIYEELEETTKKRITDENRELTNIKASINNLQETITQKADLEQQKAEAQTEANQKDAEIAEARGKLKKAQDEITKLQQAQKNADQAAKDIEELKNKATEKLDAKTNLEQQIETAQRTFNNEAIIIAKVKEHDEAAATAAELKAQEPVLKEKEAAVTKLNNEIQDLGQQKQIIQGQLEQAQKIIDNEPNIIIKFTEYETTKTKITQLQTKQTQLDPKKVELNSIRSSIGALDTDIIETNAQIDTAEAIIEMSAEILDKAKQYDEVTAAIDDMDTRAKKYFRLQQDVNFLSIEKTRIAEAGANRIRLAEQTIEALKAKAEMLNSSGCIDPQNAKCAFLKDAFEARAQAEEECKKLAQIIQEVEQDNIEAAREWKDKTAERDTTGFDDEKQKALKAEAIALKPYFEKAAKLEGTRGTLSVLKAKLTDAQTRWQQLKNKAKELEQEIADLEAELIELPQLAAAMPELEKWANAKDRLPAAKETMAQGQQRIEILGKALEAKGYELDAAWGKINEIKELLKPLAGLYIKIENLKPYVAAEKELPAAKQILKLGGVQLAAIIREVAEIGGQIDKKQKEYNAETLRAEGLFLAEIEAENIKKELADLENQQKLLLQQLGSIDQQLKAMAENMKKIEELTEKQSMQAAKVVRLQKLANAWSPDGIPFQIIRAILPELTAISNNILGQMTGGKMAIEIKPEKVIKSNKNKEVTALEVFITDVQHGTLPYLDKSGGQRVKAALASVLGLAEIKRSRAGMQLAMLHIDEPPFLDDEGKQAYIDALETIHSRYSGMKIIAITHEQEMKARFPQAIEVIGTEQGSKIIFE